MMTDTYVLQIFFHYRKRLLQYTALKYTTTLGYRTMYDQPLQLLTSQELFRGKFVEFLYLGAM